jgi:aldose 1-epimerase
VTSLVELRAGTARATLAPEVGGAVVRYECNGEPILRPTTAATLAAGDVLGVSSYPLVPFSNRIAGATLHWEGKTYRLPRYLPDQPHAIHGNGWRRRWEVIEQTPAGATLELEHSAAGPGADEWPFAYRARQTFALAPDDFSMTLSIANAGDVPFPFGLGWHPFFPRNASTVLGFAAAGVWQTDPTLLPARLDRVPSAWDFGIPRAIGATTLDNCFAGWRPPATLRWPDRRLAAAIAADDSCTHLVVFIPPECDYLAIEPVTHMTDAFNRADAGERDTGTRVLAPGERFSCTMRISVSSGLVTTDAPGV